MGSCQSSYLKPTNQQCVYHLKQGTGQLLFDLSIYLNIFRQLEMNERLPVETTKWDVVRC